MLDYSNIIDISIPPSDNGASGRVTTCTYFGLEARLTEADLEPGDSFESVEARTDLDNLKLNSHIGVAMVFELNLADSAVVDAEAVRSAMKPWLDKVAMFGSGPAILPERILFKTANNGSHPQLSADAVLYLSAEGTALIGVESATIGGEDSESIELLLREHDIVRLTNLDLSKAKPMTPYFLSAVPLLANYKGEVPTRAVLIAIKED